MNPQSNDKNDRPHVALSLSDKGLTVRWGPQEGPWDIFSGKPSTCTIKSWELHVGTKKYPSQQDDPNEQIANEIIPEKPPKKMSKNPPRPEPIPPLTETEMLIPREKLEKKVRPNEQILARVIGYFECTHGKNQVIKRGIYSDIARLVMDNSKAQMSSAS